MSAKSTVTVLGAVTVLLIGGVFVALPVLAQDGGDGVELPTPSGDADDPYDCSDFESVEQLREYYDPGNDVSDLDSDNEPEEPDKIACESDFPNQEPYDTQTPTPEEDTETPTPEEETETPTPEEETETPTPEEETQTPTPTPDDEMNEEQKEEQTEDKKEEMKDEQKEEKQDDEMKEDKKDEKQDKQMEEETDDEQEEMHDEEMDDTEEEQPPC